MSVEWGDEEAVGDVSQYVTVTGRVKFLFVAATDTILVENMQSYFGFCFCKNGIELTFGGVWGYYQPSKYQRDGRWFMPRIRAKGYAEERKAKVHQRGEKEGQELTEYEKGLRSGYLLSQADHAGQYKYSQARDAGFSKKEAGELSKKPWKEIKPIIAKKRKDKGGDAA